MRDRGKDVGPPPHRCATVSICNIYRPFLAPDVTDRDELFSGTRLSQSVTSNRQIGLYLLQIETNRRHLNRKSKSVTPGPLLAAKMLQIETDRKPPQRGQCAFVVVAVSTPSPNPYFPIRRSRASHPRTAMYGQTHYRVQSAGQASRSVYRHLGYTDP